MAAGAGGDRVSKEGSAVAAHMALVEEIFFDALGNPDRFSRDSDLDHLVELGLTARLGKIHAAVGIEVHGEAPREKEPIRLGNLAPKATPAALLADFVECVVVLLQKFKVLPSEAKGRGRGRLRHGGGGSADSSGFGHGDDEGWGWLVGGGRSGKRCFIYWTTDPGDWPPHVSSKHLRFGQPGANIPEDMDSAE
ncbi:hypothetical protein K438DRAFT_1762327 [Mycena galopus ATCC 62051]|nr:hypothetical protein K438DRAFT_1762327 [Mycena galopus ATCC 62051]